MEPWQFYSLLAVGLALVALQIANCFIHRRLFVFQLIGLIITLSFGPPALKFVLRITGFKPNLMIDINTSIGDDSSSGHILAGFLCLVLASAEGWLAYNDRVHKENQTKEENNLKRATSYQDFTSDFQTVVHASYVDLLPKQEVSSQRNIPLDKVEIILFIMSWCKTILTTRKKPGNGNSP